MFWFLFAIDTVINYKICQPCSWLLSVVGHLSFPVLTFWWSRSFYAASYFIIKGTVISGMKVPFKIMFLYVDITIWKVSSFCVCLPCYILCRNVNWSRASLTRSQNLTRSQYITILLKYILVNLNCGILYGDKYYLLHIFTELRVTLSCY